MRILLAVDQSEMSNAAADYLKRLHFNLQVDLEVVSVLPPLPTAGEVGLDVPDADELALVEEHANRIASQFEGTFHSVKSTVKVGAVFPAITELATSSHADLVVLGAVGHSKVQGVLLGSVAEYVAHQANASTLIVRPLASKEPKKTPCRVLVAVENTPHDQKMLSNLHALQFDAAAEIHLVHVMPVMNFLRQDLRKRSPQQWNEAHEAAVQQARSLEEMVARFGYKAHGRVLEAEHVGKALVTYAEDNHVDLVVSSDRGHNSLDRLLLGGTSRFLLRQSPGCVLVVKDQEHKRISSY